MKINIYCLYDSQECRIRYIGRTKKVLNSRLCEHICHSKYYQENYPNRKVPRKVNWINNLLKKGRKPKIRLLAIIEGWSESHEFERFLISKYKNSKDLVNWEDRGEGGFNNAVSEEARLKISNSLKTHFETNENPRSQPVDVFNLDGKKVGTYNSLSSFCRDNNLSVKRASRLLTGSFKKTIKQYAGYQLRWKSEGFESLSPIIYDGHKNQKKRVKYTNLLTGEIGIIDGLKECSTILGKYSMYVNHALRKSNKSTKEYKFELL